MLLTTILHGYYRYLQWDGKFSSFHLDIMRKHTLCKLIYFIPRSILLLGLLFTWLKILLLNILPEEHQKKILLYKRKKTYRKKNLLNILITRDQNLCSIIRKLRNILAMQKEILLIGFPQNSSSLLAIWLSNAIHRKLKFNVKVRFEIKSIPPQRTIIAAAFFPTFFEL